MLTLCAACQNQIERRTGEPRLSRGCDASPLHRWTQVSSGAAAQSRCRRHEADTRSLRIDCGLGGPLASASAQGVRTEAQCSPVIDRTQGNVTINFTGGCTAGITPAQIQQIIDDVLTGRAVPELLESYERLAQRFGVTRMAVTTFFRVLGERNVAVEDLDAKLREIAARHLTLLKQVETLPGEDPQVASLKKEAVAAIGAGDYARAQALLEQASDADLVAARKALDTANRRYVAAAKTKADLGQLKLIPTAIRGCGTGVSGGGRSGACERAADPSAVFGRRRHGGT